ncbi:polymorphic toxin-type HINT domain-containing protein [Actinosynnema sp. NPDC023794]
MRGRSRFARSGRQAVAVVVAFVVAVAGLPAWSTPGAAEPVLPAGASKDAPGQRAGLAGDARDASAVESSGTPDGGPRWPYERPEVVGTRVSAPDPALPGDDVAGVPAVRVEPAKQPPGFDAEKSKEDVAKRKADSTEYANPDGSRTLRVFGGTRFKESGGKLEPVENTLERTGNGRVKPKNAAPVTIGGKGDDAELVSFELAQGSSASFALDGAAPVVLEADDLRNPGRGQGKARFKGIRPHADLELTPALWGVKEDIVLRSPDAPAVWDFTLKLTGGLRAELDPANGSVLLKSSSGGVEGVIPPGFMVDSKIDPRSGEGVRSNGVKYALSRHGSTTKLRIELDTAWLEDPARVYPVVVDPTIRDHTDSDDTYVMTNAPAYPSWSESELKVGTYDGGGHVAASFLHFNEAFNNLRNHYVLGATLNLHEIYSYCCPAQARELHVQRVTSPWGTEVASWPGPSYDGTVVGSINASHGTSAAWLSIPIAGDRMTRWVHGTEAFHGFRLGASHTDSYAWKRLSSAQATNAGAIPFLDVVYSVEGATYGLPHGGYSTPVTSVSDGTIPVDVTNWGVSTWSAGGSFGLRQSIYNSAGEDMIDKLGQHGYRHFTVPATTWTRGSVRIDVKTPKLPPGSYRLVLGMEQAGAGNYWPFSDVQRLEATISVPNTPPTIKGNHPANNAIVDTLRPTLWVNYSDPDNWPNAGRQHWFELCGGTPQAPVGCVNSGWQNSPSWTPPSGPLSWSKDGHWYVKLSDNNVESGKLGPLHLTPVVPQPEITSRLVGATDGGDVPGVNPQAGNFGSTAVDVDISVAGPPLSISRTYNSQDPRSTGAFGTGWTTPLDQRITADSDGNVVVTLVTGLQLRFGRNPDGTYAPPPGVNLTLVRTASDWTLRDAKGTKRVFDTQGRLVKVHDASGNTQSMIYDGTSTHVSKVKDDHSGRQLHLSWVGGHVVSVSTDAPGANTVASRWTYDYSGHKLTKVCSPLTTESCVDYQYGESSHYRSAVLDDNPTAYWTLGEATGATANNVAARTAGEWNGAYHGVAQGRAGAITGSTDFGAEFAAGAAVVAPDDLLNKDMSFSLEVWFKAAPGKSGVLFSHQNTELGTTPTNYAPLLHVDLNGKLSGNAITTSGGMHITSTARVDDGAWHHAVLTTAVDTHTLFLDGQQVGQVTGKTIDHELNHKVLVGTGHTNLWPNAPAGSHPFTGALDEAAVYRHALTPAQVTTHHALRSASHRLTKVVEPSDFTATAITYDGQGGRVGTLTDRNGATWTVGASTPSGSAVRTVTVKSTVRGDITYSYDTANGGRIIERKDQFGAVKWEYNAAGYVHRTIDETGWTRYTDTDARGNVVRSAHYNGGRYSYRGYGYFLNTADPLDPRNDTLAWETNGYGWGDEDAYKTSYEVDAAGRVTKTTYPRPVGVAANPTETFRYATGAETSVDGGKVPAGKLLAHTDQRGGLTQYWYWGTGDFGSVVDQVGRRYEHSYDALGRVKRRTGSVRSGTTWTYTGTTEYAYNAVSRPVEVKEPPTANAVTNTPHRLVTKHVYDRAGRLTETTVSDANGNDAPRTTKFGYDAAGRLTSTTLPDQTVRRQEWDAAGDVVKTVDTGNRVLEHRFDDRHLLVETAAVGAGVDPLDAGSTRMVVQSLGYDPMGRLASVVDAQGRERTYTYHGNGPLAQERQVERDAAGAITDSVTLASYTYDGVGNVVKLVTAGSRTSRYVHDAAGLLAGGHTGETSKHAQSYTRDAMGNPTSVSNHTGVAFTSQDDASFLDSSSPDTSQVDGPGARFADNDRSWVYRLTLPPAGHVSGQGSTFTGGELTLRLSNQFLVEAGSDRTTWTELGRETQAVTNRSNTGDRTYDVSRFLSSRTVYIRIRDSRPADGWGGRVEALRLRLTDSTSPTTKVSYEYDAAGRQTKEVVDNPGGTPSTLATTYLRDPRGLVTSVTSPGGGTTSFAYDNSGALVSTTLPAVDTWVAGQRTTGVTPQAVLGRNTYGEVVETRDPAGATSRAEYDAMGRVAKEVSPDYTRPDGQVLTATTSYRYDDRGLPVEVTDARGGVTALAHDHYGRVVRTTAPDPDGDGPQAAPVTTHEYDRVGQLLKTTDPAGGTTSATYDTRGRRATATTSDRIGGQTVFFTTAFEHNDAGEVTRATTPTGATTKFTYNDVGELKHVLDPAGVWDDREYDHSGRLLGRMIGEEIGESYRYDAAGRLVAKASHTGAYGRYDPALRTTRHSYDADGRLTEAVSGEGRVSRRAYDAAGRTTTITQLADAADPTSAVTVQLGYDAAGRTTRMVDGNGNATDYTHNAWGLPESTVEAATAAHPAPSDRTWTTTYDVAGLAVAESLPGGVTVGRTFDALGRLTRQTGDGTASANPAKEFAYDAAGRVAKVSGPAGDTTYTWNDRGLLTGSTGGSGTATFQYDGDGRLTERVDKAGAAAFAYHPTTGKLSSTTDPLTGRTASYTYDADLGLVTSIGYGTGAASRAFQYDGLGRLDLDQLVKPDGSVAASTDYDHDRDDLITKETTAGVTGEGLNAYAFDGLGRLRSWLRPDGAQETYTWDKASNRTAVTTAQGTRTATYDARNRLTAVTGGGVPDVTNTHTPRGTVRSSQSGSVTTEYQFDAYERMTEAKRGAETATYQYDALDRLVTRNGAGFAYAGLDNSPVGLPGDTLVSRDALGTPQSDRTGTGPARSLLTDTGRADVTAGFDPATGAVGGSTSYSPFGERTGEQGALGYQGGYTDPLTGQVNAHARWYDPATGAFTSRDTWTLPPSPVVQANRYTYANANPVNHNDPSGHAIPLFIWAAIAVVGIATGAAVAGRPNPNLPPYPSPGPERISGCSRCGMKPDSSPTPSTHLPVPNPTQGVPTPGQKPGGTGTGKIGGGTGTGKGHVTVPTPPRPPIAEINNSNPAPAPTIEQSTAWVNRPSASVGTGQGAIQIGNGSTVAEDLPYAPGQANGLESSCSFGCQVDDFFNALGNAVTETVMGAIDLTLIAAKCSTPLAAIAYRHECLEYAQNFFGTVEFLVTDPVGFATGLWDATVQPIIDADQAGRHGAALGMAVGGLLDFVVGGKGMGKLGRAGAASCKNSFTADTEVLMADGARKAIDAVRVGDEVVATDPETGETGARTVTRTVVGRGEKALVDVTVDADGAAGDDSATITATHNHPFWVNDRGEWVDAERLAAGDVLRSSDGAAREVLSVTRRTVVTTVHNLTVQGVHTYFVVAGAISVLVHNCGNRIASEDDAWLSLDRAMELQSTRDDGMVVHGTTAVIGVYNTLTHQTSTRLAINGPGEMPGTWTLRPGETFVQGARLRDHGEETILNNMAAHEHAIFGAASRNFCVANCLPHLDVRGAVLLGEGMFPHLPQNSPFRLFYVRGGE